MTRGRRTFAAAAAAAAAISVAGCGAQTRTAGAGAAGLGRAIATAAAPTRAPTLTPDATRDPGRPVPPRGCPPRDLDAPATGCASSRPLLLAAATFAAAYLLYQTGHLTPAVRTVLERACVPGFARELVSQPVSVPRGTTLAPERLGRVTLAGGDRVDVTWTAGGPSSTAQLRLERRGSRWLVASLRPLI